MASVLGVWQRGTQVLSIHPRVGLAVRTALAAAVAWFIAGFIPGVEEYPYYAPLGALVATSFNVSSTLRETLRAGLAVGLGAVIGLAGHALLPSGVLTIAVVVGLGILVAGLPLFGELGSWVPTAALFMLILGGRDPLGYPAAYGGLVLLGGLIGTVVVLLFPQLPLAPTERASVRLRSGMVDQLEQLADGLEMEGMPDGDGWRQRMLPLDHWMSTTRRALRETEESRRWNLRAARRHSRVERVGQRARVLERVAWLVQDLVEIISQDERNGNAAVGLGPDLRPQTARVLRALAGAMDPERTDGASVDALTAAGEALDTLASYVGEVRTTSSDGHHVASNVVNSVRRILLLLRGLPEPARR